MIPAKDWFLSSGINSKQICPHRDPVMNVVACSGGGMRAIGMFSWCMCNKDGSLLFKALLARAYPDCAKSQHFHEWITCIFALLQINQGTDTVFVSKFDWWMVHTTAYTCRFNVWLHCIWQYVNRHTPLDKIQLSKSSYARLYHVQCIALPGWQRKLKFLTPTPAFSVVLNLGNSPKLIDVMTTCLCTSMACSRECLNVSNWRYNCRTTVITTSAVNNLICPIGTQEMWVCPWFINICLHPAF